MEIVLEVTFCCPCEGIRKRVESTAKYLLIFVFNFKPLSLHNTDVK
jgi:hypothetical protein